MKARALATASIAGKALAGSVALYAATLWGRLGFFLPVSFLLALGLLVVATRGERRVLGGSSWLVGVVALGFSAASVATFRGFTTHETLTKPMTIEQGENGLLLVHERHWTHFALIASDTLLEGARSGNARVVATFSLTRDAGCLRGESLVGIEGVTDWTWHGGGVRMRGAGSTADLRSPWGTDPWWCP